MNSLLVLVLLMISGCQYPTEPINWIVLKGTTTAPIVTPSPKSVADNNKRYKSVPIEQSSGNAMRDALDLLFAENEIETYYTSLQLVASSKAAGEQIYNFHGKAKSLEALGQVGLTEDFVIRIGRNTEGLNYSIEFIEKK